MNHVTKTIHTWGEFFHEMNTYYGCGGLFSQSKSDYLELEFGKESYSISIRLHPGSQNMIIEQGGNRRHFCTLARKDVRLSFRIPLDIKVSLTNIQRATWSVSFQPSNPEKVISAFNVMSEMLGEPAEMECDGNNEGTIQDFIGALDQFDILLTKMLVHPDRDFSMALWRALFDFNTDAKGEMKKVGGSS